MIIKEKSESSLVHTVCVSAILSGANTFIHAIRSCFDKDMHKTCFMWDDTQHDEA